jgi:hypothetical protein
LGILAPTAFAQEIPFLTEEEYRYLAGEISGDAAYEHIIDVERSGLQIYEATVAEALQGGEDYYGTVSPEEVDAYLKKLVEAGLVKLN